MHQRTFIVCFVVSFLSVFLNGSLYNEDNFNLYELLQRRDKSSSFTTAQKKVQKEVLEKHNEYRAKHCVPDLELDDDISRSAQKYAEYLADTNKFEHSDVDYGENLFEISSSKPINDYDGATPTRVWYDEIKKYDFDNPDFDEETGHFTQVVWKDTTKMGVGSANGRSGSRYTFYVVAQYSPGGNVEGGYSENVLPANC